MSHRGHPQNYFAKSLPSAGRGWHGRGLLAAAVLALLPTTAWAADRGQDDLDDVTKDALEIDEDFVQPAPDRPAPPGTPLIANKAFPMALRFEGGLTADISYGERFIRQRGVRLTAGFHLFDWLAFEAFAGHIGLCQWQSSNNDGCELAITKAVRQEGRSFRDFGEQPKMSDLWQTTWQVGGSVQWAPIYGKVSLVSEYDVSFQFYGFLGGGLDGIQQVQRQLGGAGASYSLVGPADGTYILGTLPIRPTANFGAGFRFIPWKYIALRAEVRGYTGINPKVADEDGNLVNDISFNQIISLGVSFLL